MIVAYRWAKEVRTENLSFEAHTPYVPECQVHFQKLKTEERGENNENF